MKTDKSINDLRNSVYNTLNLLKEATQKKDVSIEKLEKTEKLLNDICNELITISNG